MVQETVVDLLVVLGRRASVPVAICCSARDSLDAVCARVSASQQFSLLFLVRLLLFYLSSQYVAVLETSGASKLQRHTRKQAS